MIGAIGLLDAGRPLGRKEMRKAIRAGARRRHRPGAAPALVAAAVFQAGFGPHAAAAAPVVISGSMEGNLPVNPNDTLRAGYDFTMPGAHPAATVTVVNAAVSLNVVCADKSTVPLSISLPTYTVTIPAGNTGWFPSGDQKSPLVYQGSTAVPSTICGGAGGHAPQGALFTGQFYSTDNNDPLNIRFHYADNTAGSWSGTAHTTPGPPPPRTTSFWVQNLDSCRIAIGGGTLQLSDSAGPIASVGPLPDGSFNQWQAPLNTRPPCPQQGGNCIYTSVGCAQFTLTLPNTGTAAYQVTETSAPSGYMPCNGGSACQSEVMNITVDSSGGVQATVTNVYPDGSTRTFPVSDLITGNPYYTGAQDDPAVFFSQHLGNVSCDGDNDEDDNNTGSPSSSCDSDSD
jgi:hypothetical protein